jgi:hypothetical protein
LEACKILVFLQRGSDCTDTREDIVDLIAELQNRREQKYGNPLSNTVLSSMVFDCAVEINQMYGEKTC